jgi:hypothetical protein
VTIAATITSVQLPCNGSATQFSFNNKIFQAVDLIVTLLDTTGAAHVFTNQANVALGLSYTVQNVDVDTGCLVVFNSPPTNGWTLDLRTEIALTQSTSIKNQGAFLPELHEEAFDRITRAVQDLERQTYTFGIHGQDIETVPWPPFPLPAARAGQGIVFDAVTGLPVPGVLGTVPVTAGLIGSFLYPQTAAELAAAVTPVNYIYPPGQIDRYFVNAVPGTTDATGAFTAAIAQAQQTGGAPLLLANLYLIASSVTIPSNVRTRVQSGTVSIANAQTLTINGTFTATRQTVFTGAGVVIFGKGAIQDAFPEWWGAVPDVSPSSVVGTDSTAAMQACIYACAGGQGSSIGLNSIRLDNGYYSVGNLLVTNATTLRGTGRQTSGLIAKNGTTGLWITDSGNAAHIILEDFALYANSANCSGITNAVKLGYNAAVFGTEGYLRGLWIRDCACSGSGWHLDVNGNVAFFDLISVYGTAGQAAGQNLIRIVGAGNMLSQIVAFGAGVNAYSVYLNGYGTFVHGLEIETPQGCNVNFAPLSIQETAWIYGCVISLNNVTPTTFDHLVEFNVNAFSWGVQGLQLFNSAGQGTVTNGNIYNINKGTYTGGTLQTSVGNMQGTGSYVLGLGNGLSGTATFAAATSVAVSLPANQTISNYKVTLGGNAAGFCWVTSKTTSGFTINCSASNSNTTDWAVTL